VVRASYLQPQGHTFRVPAAPLHVTTLGKLFTHSVPLFIKQYNLIPAISWEGNCRSGVALAMRHRLSGISTYLMAQWPGKGSTTAFLLCLYVIID